MDIYCLVSHSSRILGIDWKCIAIEKQIVFVEFVLFTVAPFFFEMLFIPCCLFSLVACCVRTIACQIGMFHHICIVTVIDRRLFVFIHVGSSSKLYI